MTTSNPGDFVQRCVDCDGSGTGYVAHSYLLDDDCFFCGGILEGFLIVAPVDNSPSKDSEMGSKTTSSHLVPPRPGRGQITNLTSSRVPLSKGDEDEVED